jgi:DNA-binding CsgD family transcriptional regulator
MLLDVVSRSDESDAVAELLESTQTHPSVLVIEGEAGIGKTTLWLGALEQAHERGFRVLSARAGQAESGLAYAVLADLLHGIETEVLDGLPHLQRVALDRVLLREDGSGPATDERVVASAFLTLIDRLSTDAPVLLAIDDLQWLDPSSQAVVAFGARRLKGRIGVLVTVRTEVDSGYGAAWLQLNRLDGVERVRVSPLSLGAIHRMIASRLGRAFSRPTIVRIREISGGNPFYALELARAIAGQSPTADTDLPGSLSGLVRSRLDELGEDTRTVLLAAASVGAPTVDLLAEVTGRTTEHVVELLEVPESNGIVQIDGNRVRFTHPLLARGVYSVARPAQRRQMHRSLAGLVEMPELRARHLAFAASSADAATLSALDAAAESAGARGAPAAAAELIDLAINLGGDQPVRRIRAAEHHYRAGDSERAYRLLTPTIDELPVGVLRASALNLLAAMRIDDDNFAEAIDLLRRALVDGAGDHALIVRSLLQLSYAYSMAGMFSESVHQAREALDRALDLGLPELTSQVLAMSVMANCMYGNGVHEPSLERALELEDPEADVPFQFRASAVHMITQAWTGRLDQAHREAIHLRELCMERGCENDMMAVAGHTTMIDVWRGNFADAAVAAEETMERAEQIGAGHLRVIALTVRAKVAAYTGRTAEACDDARAAMDIAISCGSPQFAGGALMVLGFVEVSTGKYSEALATLQPLVDTFDAVPGSEIMRLWFVPDAVEAMVGVGRLDEAVPLIERLETDGRRLDRAWLLATGARCRSMWLAGQGDVDEAMRVANIAMSEHDRLPMPFERARTQLVLGALQRRQRLKQAAAQTFGEALGQFERMGVPLWAQRARDELDRTRVGPSRSSILTPTEQRIADLATSGMSNRDIATTLFISLKTVEANLTQVYRKLGIRSRAQLAQRLRNTQP